jgi:transcriptional regulator GlxA family with amidase domain
MRGNDGESGPSRTNIRVAERIRVLLVLFDGAEILDFAGPLQAFHEANALGASYELHHCGLSPSMVAAQGMQITALEPLPDPQARDLVLIPGSELSKIKVPAALRRWLHAAAKAGAQLCSVCTGAFVLGEAGLLDGKKATTHWKRVDELRQRFPRARVEDDVLFTVDGNIICSAGIAAGIDMALALIESHHGAWMASRVAREMVVYTRREGHHSQQSVYLDHRSHMDPMIHEVQDHLAMHPDERSALPTLARKARMSVRTLTRKFRAASGVSIAEFRTRARLEKAASLLHAPEMTLERVAELSGFRDAAHLRKAWTKMQPTPLRRRAARIH